MPLNTDEALRLLGHRHSPQRRRGAKRLRALADRDTASHIRTALQLERKDERTWETQYQLIMALGATGDRSDINLLRDIVATPLDATIIYCAVGDAIVRLGRKSNDDSGPLLWCLAQPERELLDEGALRATAQLRLVPDGDGIPAALAATQRLLHNSARPNDLLGLWGLIAAAGWRCPVVHDYLMAQVNDHRLEVRQITQESLQGRFAALKGL